MCLFCFSVTQLHLWLHFSCQQAYNFECIKITVRFFREILLFSAWFLYDSKELTNFRHSQGKCFFSIVEKKAKRHVKLYLRNVLWGKDSDAAPIITSNFYFLKEILVLKGHRTVYVGRDLKSHVIPPSCHGQGHFSSRPGCSVQAGLEHQQILTPFMYDPHWKGFFTEKLLKLGKSMWKVTEGRRRCWI